MSDIESNNGGVKKETRAFTIKALLTGFIGLFIVAAFSKTNVEILKGGDVMACSLGIGAYFYFFLICAFWNPLTSRFLPALKFNIKELALILIMTLVAGGFAYVGWMRQFFTQTGLLPIKATSLTDWKEYKIFELFKPEIFPNNGVVDETINNGLSGGLGYGEWLNITDVPYHGWANLIYWGPLFMVISFMMLGMLMLVHKQWIKHEKLSYPLATIAESLLYKSEPKNHFADIFKNKLFWWGFTIVMFIHMYNYSSDWFPDYIHKIPLGWYLDGLESIFPAIRKTGCWNLRGIHLYFMMFGIAYFLASSLSMTIGLSTILYFMFASQIYYITGSAPTGQNMETMRFGAYIAFACTLIFLGRHFYGPIMLQAMGFKRTDEENKDSVFAARQFLICFLGMIFILTTMGFDLLNACIFTLVSAVMFLVFTRIICEAGIPFMQSGWTPSGTLPRLFGGSFIGPKGLMLQGLLSGVLCRDPRQLLMPYMATGAKLGEDTGIKRRKFFTIIGICIVAAFVIAVVINLWEYYSFGVQYFWCQKYGWNCGTGSAVNEIAKLHINGQYEAAASASLGDRFSLMSFDSEIWMYFLAGFLFVLLMSFLRIRFLWWPVHGLLFCIWRTWPANLLAASFLMGWIVRSLIVKFGGERNYIKLKPLFIGLIFGEIAAIGVLMLFQLAYYLIYGITCPITSKIFVS